MQSGSASFADFTVFEPLRDAIRQRSPSSGWPGLKGQTQAVGASFPLGQDLGCHAEEEVSVSGPNYQVNVARALRLTVFGAYFKRYGRFTEVLSLTGGSALG